MTLEIVVLVLRLVGLKSKLVCLISCGGENLPRLVFFLVLDQALISPSVHGLVARHGSMQGYFSSTSTASSSAPLPSLTSWCR